MIRLSKKFIGFNWRYGIGEVVLIFIGITLAIWFDTWNQHRLDEIKENQYLKELRSDLESDKDEFRFLIGENLRRMREINKMNQILSDNQIEIQCDSVQRYVANSSFIHVFNGSSTVFQDLQSTGNLLLIEDNGFKRSLMKYYSNVAIQKKYEDLNSRFHINTQGVYIKEVWNTGGLFRLGRGEKGLTPLKETNDCQETIAKVEVFRRNDVRKEEFVNHLNFSYFIASINTVAYQNLLAEVSELLEKVKSFD